MAKKEPADPTPGEYPQGPPEPDPDTLPGVSLEPPPVPEGVRILTEPQNCELLTTALRLVQASPPTLQRLAATVSVTPSNAARLLGVLADAVESLALKD